MDVVNALQPRTYKWKDDFADGRTGTRYGFIAQEIENASGVEKEMNLFSTTETMNNPENEELTEKYETAISDGKQYATQLSAKEAVLISAIKELSAKVKALEDA